MPRGLSFPAITAHQRGMSVLTKLGAIYVCERSFSKAKRQAASSSNCMWQSTNLSPAFCIKMIINNQHICIVSWLLTGLVGVGGQNKAASRVR